MAEGTGNNNRGMATGGWGYSGRAEEHHGAAGWRHSKVHVLHLGYSGPSLVSYRVEP